MEWSSLQSSWRRLERSAIPWSVCLLGALAVLCGTLSNFGAPTHRKLPWIGNPPDVKIPESLAPIFPKPTEAPLPPSKTNLPVLAPGSNAKGPVQHPEPQTSQRENTPVEALSFVADPSRPIREINARDAWKLFQRSVPFIDARSSYDFEAGHIAGARSMPLWESDLEARLQDFTHFGNHVPQDPLVVYCNGVDCPDSHQLASRLVMAGFRNVLVFPGGFPEWSQLGHPIKVGK